MRFRGRSPVLWRCTGESQIGAEPGLAVVVEGLSPAEQTFLDRLPADLSPGDVYQTARWSEVPVDRARDIVARLDAAGVLTDDGPAPDEDDLVYWERLDAAPRERLTALRDAVVGVVGEAEPARELLGLLAETGVRTLLPEDEELSRWVGGIDPPVRRRVPLGTRPDLVVSVGAHLVEPVLARSLTSADIPHLPVVVREVSTRVGPLLVPGSPPCPGCLDLRERDADPHWPSVATQLRVAPAPRVERLLLHQAATLAARAVIDVLTGRAEAWRGRSVEVSALDPVGVERLWRPHPDCLCGWLGAPVTAPADPADAIYPAAPVSGTPPEDPGGPAPQTPPSRNRRTPARPAARPGRTPGA